MQITDFSISNPVKVAVGVILVVMFGLIALLAIPVQLTPEVSKPTITVETDWPGASPQEVEKEIVDVQEEQLKSIEGMTEFKSTSGDGKATITMEFNVGINKDSTLLKVANALDQVQEYPEEVEEPRLETVNTSDSPIAWFVLMPVPPTPGEIERYIKRYPHLEDVLRPLLESDEVSVPMLTRLANEHEELSEILDFRTDVSRMRRFVEDKIEARLEQVEGVANSNVIGGREEEMHVVVDPARLAARQITIPELRAALRGENRDTSGGDIWDAKRRYKVRTLGQFESVSEIENTIVARRDESPVYIKDVAEVTLGYEKPTGVVRQQGVETIAINVQREEGANVLEVMEGVRAAVDELNEGALAARGMYLWQVYDETAYITSATALVRNNIFVGGALAIAVLLIFLRSGRSTLVAALAIPISVIGTFLVISALGRSINVISLAGMAFAVGMVVDNAIVVLENIYSHYQRGATPFQAASRGTSEVWGAVLASTLTTLAVFLPVVFVQEQAGQLFRDIAIAISVSVALSLIISLTVIPSAASRLLVRRKQDELPKSHHRTKNPLTVRLGQKFVDAVVRMTRKLQAGRLGIVAVLVCCVLFAIGAFGLVPISRWIVRDSWPYQVPVFSAWGLALAGVASLLFIPVAYTARRLAIVVTMIMLSLGLGYKMIPPAEYLPEGNRNLVIGILKTPPGYNLDQKVAMGRIIESRLRPYWEFDPNDPDEAAKVDGPHIANFFYVARDGAVFMGAKTTDPMRASELAGVFRGAMYDLPGVQALVSQASLFERGLSGGRAIDIDISGPDLDELIALGGQIMGGVTEMYPYATTETMAIPEPSLDLGSPELHIRRKAEKGSGRGVTTDDLGYTVNALVDGAFAGDYWHEGQKIDLVITADESAAERTQDVADIPIGTPSGEIVPLSAVANVSYSSGPEQINRIDRERAITIQVKPGPGVALEEAIARLDAEVLSKVRQTSAMQSGLYNLTMRGTADELQQMRGALLGNFILALVITYLLIAALYESFLYPLVIMVSVPMAAVGGFAGLQLLNLFTPQAFDTLTMLGFVILVGTVVNNAILIVNQALVNIREEDMDHLEAVVDSVQKRVRPIFMSTATTVFGMLPLVVWPGAGSELYRGLGSVVLGGLIVSTVFTLILVPMLFTLMRQAKTQVRMWLGLSADEEVLEEIAPQVERPVRPVVTTS